MHFNMRVPGSDDQKIKIQWGHDFAVLVRVAKQIVQLIEPTAITTSRDLYTRCLQLALFVTSLL
jgi:hypothetical protein